MIGTNIYGISFMSCQLPFTNPPLASWCKKHFTAAAKAVGESNEKIVVTTALGYCTANSGTAKMKNISGVINDAILDLLNIAANIPASDAHENVIKTKSRNSINILLIFIYELFRMTHWMIERRVFNKMKLTNQHTYKLVIRTPIISIASRKRHYFSYTIILVSWVHGYRNANTYINGKTSTAVTKSFYMWYFEYPMLAIRCAKFAFTEVLPIDV